MVTKVKTILAPIQAFFAVWLCYAVLLILIPAVSRSGDQPFAALLTIFFVVCAAISAVIICAVFYHPSLFRCRPINFNAGPSLRLSRWVGIATLLSIVGTLLLWFDRVQIQGIDYSDGIAAAREAWSRTGQSREGVSSLASVIGYMLSGCLFPLIAILVVTWERIVLLRRWLVMASAILAIAANSLLTGGRSVLLLAAVVALSGCIIRRIQGRKLIPGGARIAYPLAIVLFVVGLAYSLWVFAMRAQTHGTSPALYLSNFTEYLGGQLTPQAQIYFSGHEGPIAAGLAYVVLTAEYLVHSFWSFAIVIEAKVLPGHVSFTFVQSLLAKLSLAPEVTPYMLSGRFFSVPGAFWYDFGISGVLISSIGQGVLLALGVIASLKSGSSILSLMIATCCFTVAMLSPLILAVDILYFPFMVIGFLLIGIVKSFILAVFVIRKPVSYAGV